MAKKLGRGLSHLLPTAIGAASPAVSDHPEYRELAIDEIRPNPDQPRRRFDEKEIQELSKTLHSVGLIEPIIVRRVKDSYQLISGERRLRACQLAGFKRIPAIVKQLNDALALEMGIIENIQREDLNPIEEARAYEALIGKTGLKPSLLAEKVGKDRTTITNLLRLLKLPEPIQDLIENKQMTAGQARPLLALGDKKTMLGLARKTIGQGWNARRVEDEVSLLTDPGGLKSSGTARSAKKDPNVRSLEEKIRKRFMAKVRLEHTKRGGGRISIHFASLDDLDRILELMGIK